MKVLAVGDIHTKLWIIDSVERIVDNYDAIVFVGDYADDWGKSHIYSIETWRRLKKFQEKYPQTKMTAGNHDYIYSHYTKTTQGGYDRLTQATIDMPENRDLREWLRTLPITVELDGVTYSHAGITDTFKMEYTSKWLWEDDSPIWARPDWSHYIEMPQVFGHTPSETCWEVQPNIWCIDTFSTYPDGTSFGDHTVLEITDGKTFNKIKLEKQNARDNNSTSGIS